MKNSRRRNAATLEPPYLGVVVAVVVVLFLSSLLVRDARAAELYEFQSHRRLARGDEETASLRLASPFPFLQRNFSRVTVSPAIQPR